MSSIECRSREYRPHRRSVVDFQTLPAWNLQTTRIQPQKLQHRGMKVGHVMRLLDGMETQFVSSSVNGSTTDAGPCKPDREAVRMMISAGGGGRQLAVLYRGRPPEFGATHHQS